MTADTVSRGEFAQAMERIRAAEMKLDEMDRTGTRGVGVLAVQVAELSRDLGGMQRQMEAHHREHEQDLRDRRSQRRWAAGIIAALFAALESPLITLLLSRAGH